MPAVTERRAAGLNGVAGAGSLEPFGADGADRHALEAFHRRPSSDAAQADRIVRPRSGLASMSSRLISWMLLSLSRGCTAVIAVGFTANIRDPGIAGDVEPSSVPEVEPLGVGSC